MFELMENHSEEAVIKVVGVGGGGGNAVEYMVASSIEGVEFIAANTDAQALRNSSANVTLQLGAAVTKGFRCRCQPGDWSPLSGRRPRNHQENAARR